MAHCLWYTNCHWQHWVYNLKESELQFDTLIRKEESEQEERKESEQEASEGRIKKPYFVHLFIHFVISVIKRIFFVQTYLCAEVLVTAERLYEDKFSDQSFLSRKLIKSDSKILNTFIATYYFQQINYLLL